MRNYLPAAWLSIVLLPACTETKPSAPETRTWSFDEVAAGSLPTGFTSATGTYKVVEAAGAPSGRGICLQDAKRANPDFNVALAQDAQFADLGLTVSIQAVDGKIDQGGGPIWRARDGENYYICRYNPLEDNIRVYKVVAGKRTQLGSADLKISHTAWHSIGVRMKGDHIECFLDGQKYLDVHDKTFPGPGMVGLWTKADARTRFDDLVVVSPPPASGPGGR